MQNCILSTSYFGNIQYFSKLLLYKNILIETYENYSKQSFRNRFEILSANGKLSLSVPVVKIDELKTRIDKIRIDYTENWQKNHLKSIESAYKSSPFYEYYIDDIIDFFNFKYDNLLQHNTLLTKLLAEIIRVDFEFIFTDEYFSTYDNVADFRNTIHPKLRMQKNDDDFKIVKYYQTFKEKFEFTPNLSILDLIFNEGPRTKEILEMCIEK